jgi:hypothetical protein
MTVADHQFRLARTPRHGMAIEQQHLGVRALKKRQLFGHHR